jgi:ubiquinone/menaquinone biosynthesis C-methylase UbiE
VSHYRAERECTGPARTRGQNFPYYPASVTRLIAVEPSRRRRNRARAAARQANMQIEIVPGTAEDLPGQDGDYDAVVACLVLCSVPDQQAALSEIRRVLRPGGQLRYLEHVISGRCRSPRTGLRGARHQVLRRCPILRYVQRRQLRTS